MNRRSLLSALGLSAAGSLTPLAAVTGPRFPTRVVALESFRVTHADRMAGLHAYLGGALLPLLDQIHHGPKIFMEAVVAPHTPQAVFLTAFSSFDEMLDIRNRIAAHPGIRQARADLESGDFPVLDHVRSQVLTAPDDSLRFPAAAQRVEGGVFELRSYYAPTWHDGPPARATAALHRAGIHPILNACTAACEHLPRLTYLIPFESLAARQEAWAKLDAGLEWNGPKVTASSIYKLAPYSPLA